MNQPLAPRESPAWLNYGTVSIVSASGLLFEFIQTRILSFIFWNHVVYLAISIALLGFGISGTVVSWLMRRDRFKFRPLMAALTSGMAVSLLFSVFFIQRCLPLVRTHAPSLRLMACYLVSVPPFIFSGAALSFLFARSRQSLGRLYRADLASAGAGCVIFFFFLPALGAVAGIAVLSALLLVLSCVWAWPDASRWKYAIVTLAVAAIVIAEISVLWPQAVDFQAEPYKEMADMLAHGGYVERTKWTTLSRIDVVAAPSEQLYNYAEYPPGSYKVLTQDGSANTSLPGKNAIASVFQRVQAGEPPHPAVLPYAILNHPDVAIIGTGGGIDTVDALSHKARSVLTIELNPFTFDVNRNIYADWNGRMLHDTRVYAINSEGRSAIRSIDRKFDLLQVIAIDTFAALNSGAYVLSENYLYTVEAFRDYFAHLKPGGVLSLYRWNYNPPRETLRLTMLAGTAWRQQGIRRIDDRIMVVGTEQWAMTLFKNGPFTAAETAALARVTAKLHETVFYWPNVLPQQQHFEADYYRTVTDPSLLQITSAFHRGITSFQGGKEASFFASYPYKVTPTTDDSPFFFESSSLSDIRNWSFDELRGSGVQATLLQILITSTVVMLGAILLPLWIYQRKGLHVRGVGQYSCYFAALGLAFMIVEISLMQKCVLILGNPMYSIPVLLAAILGSAGIGSGIGARWQAPLGRKVALCSALVAVTLAASATLLTGLAPVVLRFAFIWRALFSAAMAAPVAFFMGMFFPEGLHALREQAPEFIPWAWGINGCASVYGSVAAILLAMWHGFNFALGIGILAYLLAAVAAWFAPSAAETAAVPAVTAASAVTAAP